jgi:HK97 family phage prohead protease
MKSSHKAKGMNMEVKMLTGSGMKVKALEDGSVYLEGFANKAVVDRGRDLIGKKAWKLDDYKKNSIILFNHDHTKPVGKMISVEPTDEGLFVKGRISNSKDPEISRIRDLVKEGILNSLSVGFMAGDEEIIDGVNVIKSANLHECSIVAVPMNQDSQFSVTTKAMSGDIISALSKIAEWKGFEETKRFFDVLSMQVKSVKDFDALVKLVCLSCQTTDDEAIHFLKMESQDLPLKIKDWMMKNEAACDPAKEKAAPSLPDGSGVFAVLVPSDQFATQDDAAKWATDSGWSSDNISRNDTTGTWIFQQADAGQFEGEMSSIDLGDGVTAQIGKLVKDKADMVPPEEEPIEEPAESESEGAAVVVEIETEDKSLLDGINPTTVVTGNDASHSEVNPALDQSKQTNVLLGNMIMLLQQMNETLSGLVSKPEMVSSAAPEPAPVMSPEEQDMTKSLNLFLIETGERLAKLGL